MRVFIKQSIRFFQFSLNYLYNQMNISFLLYVSKYLIIWANSFNKIKSFVCILLFWKWARIVGVKVNTNEDAGKEVHWNDNAVDFKTCI